MRATFELQWMDSGGRGDKQEASNNQIEGRYEEEGATAPQS